MTGEPAGGEKQLRLWEFQVIMFAGEQEATLGPVRATTRRSAAGPASAAQAFKEISGTVKAQGLLKRSPVFYSVVSIGLFVALAAALAGVVLLGESWLQLILAAALGLIFTQVAFLGHEASHRQIFASGPANDRLGRVLATLVVGISYSWWMNKHNRHHGNPNKVGKDPDIEVDTISFLEEDAARSRGLIALITRLQGYLFFPLLLGEGANLHYRSIVYLFRRSRVKGRALELTLVSLRFLLYFGFIFAVMPLGMGFAFIGVQMAVFGLYMGATFAPNHKGMPIIARDAKVDFFSKQVRTSRNISGGWWATVLMGGLNYQIEHHLFPSMSRPQLAQARLLVRDFCHVRAVPYTEVTLLRSYAIVIAYLNRVGLAARDPFECPMIAQYRGL